MKQCISSMEKNNVILVDQRDRPLGVAPKEEVHQTGTLHRAISVLIFNSSGDLLLQQRAEDKYHCPGLWSNTCCTHPMPKESSREAAERRLMEEMGLAVKLRYLFHFTYFAVLDNDLIEHELDHVFTGVTDDPPTPNKEEVKAWQYMAMDRVKPDILQHKRLYTPWIGICLDNMPKNESAASLSELLSDKDST